MPSHRQARHWVSALLFLLIVSLIFIPIASQAAPDQSPQGQVQRAWNLAAEAGQYHFSSRVVQKTALAPTIANAGRSSRVETLYLDGQTNLPAESLQMRIWQNGGNVTNAADAVEVRVTGREAQGRVGGGSWQKIDNFTGSFAPGNDFTGFLVAAQNVRLVSDPAAARYAAQYQFDLSGPLLANHLRAQLEDHLRREGALPAGLRLNAPEQYRAAVGSGEVWLDRDGLPLRLNVAIQYPQQKNGERVSVQVFTDFSNFNREALASHQSPVTHLQSSISNTISQVQQPENLISIAFLGLLGLGLINSKAKHVYVAIVVAVICSMVVTPLIQGYQVYAFYQEQEVQQEQYAAAEAHRQAEWAAQAEMNGYGWDPHQNLLANTDESTVNSQEGRVKPSQPAAPTNGDDCDLNDDNADCDEDGLSNGDDPCPENADCDGDGLTDRQEERLGTDPEDKDTDGDQITDNAEIKGFFYNNQWWYTNPNHIDTNGDGNPDNIECDARQVDVEAGEVSPDGKFDTCQDTDSDGTPDPFDRDDDGDGVPDLIDLSPYEFENNAGDLFDEDHPLLFQVDGLQADQPAFVDFQIRPENEEHLWYALNVLDWPSNDERGQIQRQQGNNSTFEDIAPEGEAIAPNADNGDLRLIPMLEIEMPGDSVPLKLANPAIEVAFSGEISATVHLEQAGADIDLTFTADATYEVEINENACNDLDDALHNWDNLSDGDTRTITAKKLTELANGEHGIKLTNGSDEYCLNLGNIVNGPYADQMIDREPLDPYAISVREKAKDGTLLAYLPLNLVSDETEADRVAFAGRMHYWPQTADWGDTHKVNVVWVLQMLVDHQCSEAEDFAGTCEEDEWVLDTTQIVRAYPETWYLTGMTVREDHGVEVGVIFEDPAQESENDREYDEVLWNLAWGLDKSFLVGRDQDDDGNRDITITEIVNRWDYPTNQNNGYADGDDELWGVPITATQVLTYAYDISDQMVQMAMTETEKILDDHFKSYIDAGSEAPTLLFTQESHYRAAALGSDATTTETVSDTVKVTIQIDSEKSPEETVVSMNWATYRFDSGDDQWESYPLDEYWDRIEVRYEELFTEYQDDPDYEDLRRGQIFIAQSFYLAMYRGNSALVQVGDELIGAYHDMAVEDFDLEKSIQDVMQDGGVIARVTKLMTEIYAKHATEVGKTRPFLMDVDGYKDVFTGEMTTTKESRRTGMTVMAAWATMALYVVAEHYGIDPLLHTLNAMVTLRSVFELYKTITTLKNVGSVAAKFTTATTIGLVLTEIGTWGIFMYQLFSSSLVPGSMAANFAFATQVAGTIAGIILLMITAIPVVGQIIAAIISLFDSVVMLVCTATKSKNGICRGITGWLAFGIRWAIYSGNVMVDLGDDKRLTISDVSQDFLDVTEGMAVGNSLTWEATITNEIQHIDWTDTQGSILAGLYWWQYSDDNLRSSNFQYYLQESQNDQHSSIGRNIIPNYEWDPDEDGEDKYAHSATESTEIPLTQAGINQKLDFYLNEGYAVPAQECWLFPNPLVMFTGVPVIPVCYVRTEKGTNHINLGEKMRVDIFPATLDEFYSLSGVISKSSGRTEN